MNQKTLVICKCQHDCITVNMRIQNIKGRLQFVMQTNASFTFGNSIFVKYDLLTEYLTLFWFVMLVNECKPEFQFKRSLKNANLDNVYIW